MHALIIIGGIAFFGWFLVLKPDDKKTAPVLPQTPALPDLIAAATALAYAYRANKCAGLTVPTVQRFQTACNAYAASLGKLRTLTEDGLYDAATDAALFSLVGTSLPSCIGTFQPPTPQVLAQTPNQANATGPTPGSIGVPVSDVASPIDAGRTSSRFKYT